MSYSSGYPIYPPVVVFDVNQTWLAGMSQAQLLTLYGQMQAAQAQLMMGGKPVTVSYAQGDGSKSVTYNMTSAGQLQNALTLVQRALGLPGMSRRPMRMRYL